MTYITYEQVGGMAYKLHRGSWQECYDWIGANPGAGPRGGSVHIKAVRK